MQLKDAANELYLHTGASEVRQAMQIQATLMADSSDEQEAEIAAAWLNATEEEQFAEAWRIAEAIVANRDPRCR